MFKWSSNNNKYAEIKTIVPRTMVVKLSDADCEKISILCGRAGLTVSELIEAFIGDLVDGTHSNGSDERDLAEQWYERCGYEMANREHLLYHLLDNHYDPEDYIGILDEIESVKEDIKVTEKHIAEPGDGWAKLVCRTGGKEVPCYNSVEEYIESEKDDLVSFKGVLIDLEEELKYMREKWKTEENTNMDEELDEVRAWVTERKKLENPIIE